MNIETLNQVKEIIATLNLESETTVEVLNQLMPLLWWKLVWLPLIGYTLVGLVVAGMLVGMGWLIYRDMR